MLNRVKSAFSGKRLILSLSLSLAFLVFLAGVIVAQTRPTPTPIPTPAATKVDYVLPYPGILPDHILYPAKMLRDRILDFFIREPIKKTEFLILMADKRLGAGKTLIDFGKVSLGETTLSKGEKYLERAINSASQVRQQGKNVNDLLDKLEKSTRKHIEVLEEVSQKAPESAKPGLENALENAQKGYQRVLELKGGM